MSRRVIAGARTILTGASSGIGQAMARELGRQGARLLLTARRAERLAELADELRGSGRQVTYRAGDITSAALRTELLQAAAHDMGGLDLLINNAGVGALGPFEDASSDRLRQILEVNFFAAAELMREAIPVLRGGTQPMIVNVSSVLGHRAVPGKSEYCAAKFALHGLSDALRAELAPQGIDVLLISPSTTRSEFFESVLEDQSGQKPQGRRGMSPERVAAIAVRAIRQGRHEVILSLGGKCLVWVDRLCPRLADRLIARFG